jgi:hydroxymethylglutaryl-CoA reductase
MKFYQQTRLQRIATLVAEGQLTAQEAAFFKTNTGLTQEAADQLIENQLTTFALPEGVARGVQVDGHVHTVPMVTEEPSVIAAASHGAKLLALAGGVQTTIQQRAMVGQVILQPITPAQLAQVQAATAQLAQVANAAHPSIVARGGGVDSIRYRQLDAQTVSLDLIVDVQEAMGANMLNSMLEAVAAVLRQQFDITVLMSILSNYATTSLVTATGQVPVASLARTGQTGAQVAAGIVNASHIAQIDSYRAATHNKGLMNGIDAVVMASGNDWRAIESGAQAYAARDGQYRGLSTWHIRGEQLVGSLTLPLPVGYVGGAIRVLPAAQPNLALMGVHSAKALASVIAAVGLGQNLAALHALVTSGIQKGHMALQAKSLAATAGATPEEVPLVAAQLQQAPRMDLATAAALLQQLRQG